MSTADTAADASADTAPAPRPITTSALTIIECVMKDGNTMLEINGDISILENPLLILASPIANQSGQVNRGLAFLIAEEATREQLDNMRRFWAKVQEYARLKPSEDTPADTAADTARPPGIPLSVTKE
jgi:hypothetical protein